MNNYRRLCRRSCFCLGLLGRPCATRMLWEVPRMRRAAGPVRSSPAAALMLRRGGLGGVQLWWVTGWLRWWDQFASFFSWGENDGSYEYHLFLCNTFMMSFLVCFKIVYTDCEWRWWLIVMIIIDTMQNHGMINGAIMLKTSIFGWWVRLGSCLRSPTALQPGLSNIVRGLSLQSLGRCS